ncbi:MAG: FecR family protein [Gammaproteobacteria bacterium]|nr:FecR family protein [Gammaproteobacteria bacterium]
MNKQPTKKPERDDNMDDIGQLIRFAGPRETVDAARFEMAKARVGAHWQDVVTNRDEGRTHNRLRNMAIAAGVLIFAATTYLSWTSQMRSVESHVAYVNRIVGEVTIDGQSATAGAAVAAGSVIETDAESFIALDLATGHSLRLDRASRIEVSAMERIDLERGAIYADSGADRHGSSITIATRFGIASDIGTQFQVRVAENKLTVGVREGLVELSPTNGMPVAVPSGTLVDVASDGYQQKRDIGEDDPVWDWTSSITPEFDIEGRTLKQYLTWYARERGLLLQWQDVESHDKAGKITLTGGAISGKSLEDGFATVRRIAPFHYQLSDTTLHVRID